MELHEVVLKSVEMTDLMMHDGQRRTICRALILRRLPISLFLSIEEVYRLLQDIDYQHQNQKAKSSRVLVVKMSSFNNSYKLEIDNIEEIHMIVELVLLN